MDSKKVIQQLMLEKNTNINELAEKLGMKSQSFRNKINRGGYSLTDFIRILDLLDCDLQVVTRDSKKIFRQDYSDHLDRLSPFTVYIIAQVPILFN